MLAQNLVEKCAQLAFEKKAQRVVSLDLQGISMVADYFVICTGGNSQQVKAICDHIKEKLQEQEHISCLRIEGYEQGRWILMDYGSVIVHIFQEEERLYYNLERLWGDAPTTLYSVDGEKKKRTTNKK